MKSFYTRQFLTMAGMILFSFLILEAVFISLSYSYIVNDKKSSLAANAKSVAHTAASYLLAGDLQSDWDFRMNLSTISKASDATIFVCYLDGQIISCSDQLNPAQYIGKYVPTSVTSEIVQDGEYSSMGTLGGIFSSSRYVVGTPVVTQNNEIIGMVFLSADTSALTDLWSSFSFLFFFAAFAVMGLAFVFSSFTSKRMARPLKEMAVAARRFAHGEFDARVNSYGRHDEIEELASAFNAMAVSLEKSETLRREFIANVSHELKTPMTTISGYVEGILDGTITKDKEEEYLGVVSDEVHRLSRLVRRMLEISQLQATEKNPLKEKFDICEVMRRVLLGLEQKIVQKGLDVDAQLPDKPIYVLGDSDAITQVGYNLLENAIKFSYSGTVLKLAVAKKGGRVSVSVRNTGNEIDQEELPFIFDRFHKTDRSRSADRDGVGLGLYIVKTILDTHNESITATSLDGETEFVFTLTAA